VFVSPFVTQRDPRWFPDPDAFHPDRWREDPTCPSARPRFSWFPFGAGPRSCIGEQFARLVLVLVVATIAQTWRLRPTRPAPWFPRRRSLLTLKPRGAIWMIPEQSPL
jgi:cytochrome P450